MADSNAGASSGGAPPKSEKRKKTADDLAQKETEILKQLEDSCAELKKESLKLKAKKRPKKQRVITAVYGRPDPSGKRAEYNSRQRRNYRARVLKKQQLNALTAEAFSEAAVDANINDADVDSCDGDDDDDGMYK